MDRLIKTHVDVNSPLRVRSSKIPTQREEGIVPPPQLKLFSFDVTDLFSHNPIKTTLEYLEKMLREAGAPNCTFNDATRLLHLWLEPNYCLDEVCKFPSNAVVLFDSSLDSTVAKIFMKNFEEKIWLLIGAK